MLPLLPSLLSPLPTYTLYMITVVVICIADAGDNDPPPGPKASPHLATPPSPRRLMANNPASTALAPGRSSPHWATHPLAHPSRPLHPHLLPPRTINARHLHNPSLNPANLAHGLMRPDLMMIQQQHRHRGHLSAFPHPAASHVQHRKLMAGTAEKNHALPAVKVIDCLGNQLNPI